MSHILAKICDEKREDVAQQKSITSLEDLKNHCRAMPKTKGFEQALRDKKEAKKPGFICEIKKASPSKGLIRDDFDPTFLAKNYDEYGADCLSVLTDTPYFQGSLEDLKTVRKVTNRPLLRKDFIIDPYQIYQTRAIGADCMLLIMAALEQDQYQEFYALGRELGLDILVEIHDEDELEAALTTKPSLIGINNRNLKTMSVDLDNSMRILSKIPANSLKVSESDIHSKDVVDKLRDAHADAFLIGEYFMKQENPGRALQALCQ